MIVSSSPEAGAAVNDGRTNANDLHYNYKCKKLAFDGGSAIASHT